jgi:hypothetical protein
MNKRILKNKNNQNNKSENLKEKVDNNDNLNYKNKEIFTIMPEEEYFHPISLEIMKPDKPITLTKYYYDKKNDRMEIFKDNKIYKKDDKLYQKYLLTPTFGTTSQDLLDIYGIETIDNLKYWVNLNSNNDSYNNVYTINRVISCWIKMNLKILKTYNNFLEEICIKLLNKYYRNKLPETMDLKKEVKDFIDYWTNKINETDFKINLLNDLIVYINKKFLS